MAKKEKSKSKKIIIISVITVLVLVIGTVSGILIYKYVTAPFDSYKIVHTEQIVTSADTEYMAYANGYIRISHDGVEAIDADGLRVWNVSYNMNSPRASVCGNYVAVGDKNGRILYMMDGTGTVYKTEMPYDICEVECSNIGIAAVRMHANDCDYIRMVDLNGETLVDIKTVEQKDGFPVDIALSPDAKKLVTSYLVINGDEAGGWITFYNFGAVGKNYSNNITGVYKYDKVITDLKFISNNNLCAFEERGFKLFSVPETPTLSKEISFDNYVMCAAVGNGKVAVMESAAEDGAFAHTKAFDASGNMYFDITSNNELNGILFFGDDIMFYNDYACQLLKKDGTVRYNGNFNGHKIETLISVNGKNKFLLFEKDQVLTIQLTKGGSAE